MNEWPDDDSRLKRPIRTKPLTLPRPERMSARILVSESLCGAFGSS